MGQVSQVAADWPYRSRGHGARAAAGSARQPVIIIGGMLALARPFAVTTLVTSPAVGSALQVISGA